MAAFAKNKMYKYHTRKYEREREAAGPGELFGADATCSLSVSTNQKKSKVCQMIALALSLADVL